MDRQDAPEWKPISCFRIVAQRIFMRKGATPGSLIVEDADMQVDIRHSWPRAGSDRNIS